jgi:hypothetical protein
MKQALYEAILEDEAVLEEAFKYEALTRQAKPQETRNSPNSSARYATRTAAAPRRLSSS